MNLFQNLKERAKTFISGPSAFRIQDKISAKVITIAGIIPKKAIPRQLVDRISKPLGVENEENQQGIVAEKKVVSSLGKLTLDLVQVNNNLEKIVEIIQEDYKNTKDLNKKETEDYRKRIANRFRVIGGRELKSSKVDVTNLVKNFAGSFFKGVGGALRALAAFNFIDALMRGDPGAAIGALLGMASTYLPAIIGGVVGGITTSIFGGIKNLFRGGKTPKVPTATPVAPTKPTGPKKLPGLGKFGKMLALGTSALALGSAFGLGNKQEENQSRLEDLTQQQKGLVTPDKLVPIPQDDLKKFENLNKKFERAIDFLLGKQKEQGTEDKKSTSGQSPSQPPPAPVLPSTPGSLGSSAPGSVLATGAETSYYDPSLGGINASGAKTREGLPATSTGEAYRPEVFSAAAFPSLISKLPESMTSPTASSFPGGRTLRQPFNVIVTNSQGKQAIVRVNDVGSGASGQSSNRMLDLSVASKNYLGTGGGFTIQMAPPGSTPGPLTNPSQVLRQPNTPSISPNPPTQPRPIPLPQISSAPRRQPPATPQARTSPTILPIPIVQPEPQVPLASTVDNIDNIPNFETSYSENFLTMYSKLIYQIV